MQERSLEDLPSPTPLREVPAPPRISRRVQLRAVVRKEVRQTVRDRRMMFLLVMAPLIQTVLFGFAVDFDVDRVPTAVVDRDGSAESRLHTRRLLADGTLREQARAPSAEDAQRAIDEGQVAAALVLPPRLGRDLLAGRPAQVQVLLDGTDPNRANVVAGAVSRYFGEVNEGLMRERAGAAAPGGVSAVPRVLYNPSLRTPPFMVPGVMAMLLLVVTTIVTAMGLAREREMGTLEQVLVTPLEPLSLLAGKMAPFFVIGLVDVMLVLAFGTWLFDVPLRGPLPVLALGALLYLLSTLGVGLLISTVSGSQQQAFLGGFLFTLPAILLSGVMTPVSGMPVWLQWATRLNPVRYFVELLRAVLLRGAGLAEVWPQLLALLVFGLAILGFATLRFRKRLG
ncbi:ABC transporter permease [Aggregicoccus sp. 17bor-14]|uniref:ABC transporter permease n=1 Tax=Myxococcaceae TaxID=31 RepID=UPI00129C73BD|nr:MULTISPECIES: ABC transporter permease [Myxococcaceae]MBF5041605.1 ABC transporter permease [Simulacricoccus sp. 17bor-14]MRI87390.1 ABC transporter permease [Aggregicoccus sp. 17bor-14]